MSSRVPTYLRTHRRKWGLTQTELAKLLGSKSRASVSRLECGKRTPSVESLLSCVVLFGADAPELFPHLYSHIEERVLRSAAAFLEELERDTSLKSARKRELLQLAAHFSDRGRLFQSDRGRRFNAIVDARRCAQARGLM